MWLLHPPNVCEKDAHTVCIRCLRLSAVTEPRKWQDRNWVKLTCPKVRRLHKTWVSCKSRASRSTQLGSLHSIRFELPGPYTPKCGLWVFILEGSRATRVEHHLAYPWPDKAYTRTKVPWRGNYGTNVHIIIRVVLTHGYHPMHQYSCLSGNRTAFDIYSAALSPEQAGKQHAFPNYPETSI